MGENRQFQAIAVLSVESDLVRFSVLSATDGREIATSSKRLPLITDRTWDESQMTNRSESHWSTTECSTKNRSATERSTVDRSTGNHRSTPENTRAERVTDGNSMTNESENYGEPTTKKPANEEPDLEEWTAEQSRTKDASTGKRSNYEDELVTEKLSTTEQLPFDRTSTEQVATVETDLTESTTLNDRIIMRNLSSHELLLNDVLTTDGGENGEKCKRRRAGGAYLEPGQVEQDPDAIWNAVEQAVSDAIDKMCRDGTPVTYIKSMGITNETGTLLAWSAETNAPLHNAIHWTDVRMSANGGGGEGTAAAVEWLRRRSPSVKCAGDSCRFGTLDAWLLWKLTAGQTYVTDVTNASYTRMFDLATLDWHRDALRDADVPEQSWPAVQQPGQHAVVLVGRLLGVTVHAVMARPSATLYGQRCDSRGQVVVTMTDRTTSAVGPYGRGKPVQKEGGPRHVVGYRESGRDRPHVVYGSLAVSEANAVVCWLTKSLRLISSPDECMDVYRSATLHDRREQTDRHRPCLVSALNGLPNPPHCRPDARLVVCGITDDTGPADLIAAAVDAMCFSAVEIAKHAAAGRVDTVFVDGPYSRYPTVLQRLSDVSGSRVIRNKDDMAVHGVACMAAVAINAGFAVQQGTAVAVTYRPASTAGQRSAWAEQWAKAVCRSYGWARTSGQLMEQVDDEFARPETTRPPTISAVNLQFHQVVDVLSTWYHTIKNNLLDLIHAN